MLLPSTVSMAGGDEPVATPWQKDGEKPELCELLHSGILGV